MFLLKILNTYKTIELTTTQTVCHANHIYVTNWQTRFGNPDF